MNLAKLRERMRRYRPHDDPNGEKREAVRRVLAHEPLAETERDNAVARLMGILTAIFPIDTPKEAVEELVRPSVVSMPDTDGEGPDHWMHKVSVNFDHFHKSRVERHNSHEELKRMMRQRFGIKTPTKELPEDAEDAEEDSEPEPEDQVEQPEEDPESWRTKLLTSPDKNGVEKIRQIGANAQVILQYSPDWRGVIRFDEVSKDLKFFGGPFEKSTVGAAHKHVEIGTWLQSTWDLVLPNHEIASQLAVVARRNRFDPIQDYLNGIQWDGQHRIDSFLETYAKASDEDLEFVRLVSRRWLIGAVARALDPGCKFDNVLVLEGSEGVKKSTFFNVLGGNWFADSQININNKDSQLLAAQCWIVELAELAALRNSETSSQKAFFSRNVDRFRPPYAATIEEFKRRCVFVGTTNEEEFLEDDGTPNRRFWVVTSGEIDIAKLKRDRDQIWAEAVEVYRGADSCNDCADIRCVAHRWWLESDEQRKHQTNTSRKKTDPYLEGILHWWLTCPPQSRPLSVNTTEVAHEWLKINYDVLNHASITRIGRCLMALGFEKRRVQENNHRQVRYYATEELNKLIDPTKRKRMLRLIANAEVPQE